MSKFICLFVCFVAANLSSVYAFSPEEKKAIHEKVKPVVADCAKANGVTQEQLKAALEAGHGTNINPCFFACAMKKTEMMTPQGLFNPDSVMHVLKNLVKDEELATYREKGRKCETVNSQTVSDGEAGCERAKLILACFQERGIEFAM